MIKRKIGWQKYEDMIESQMNSPLIDSLINKTPEIEEDHYAVDSEELTADAEVLVPIDEQMLENITLTTSFDCWMGHTNFNLTDNTKSVLNKVDGIEVLKICSRYRFFIGIGKMFDFEYVRAIIERELETNQGE